MLNKKHKGFSPVQVILGFVLLIAVGSIVGTAMQGPIKNTLTDKSSNLQDKLNAFSGTVEIDAETEEERKETFGDLARYVFDRARKCWAVSKETGEHDEVNEEDRNGYPGLASTTYGQKPKCAGASDKPGRGPSVETVGGETGNDMEGKFSRINFEIKKPVEITTFEKLGNPAQHEDSGYPSVPGAKIKIVGVATKHGFYDLAKHDASSPALAPLAAYRYLLFFENEKGESRIVSRQNNENWLNGGSLTLEEIRNQNPTNYNVDGLYLRFFQDGSKRKVGAAFLSYVGTVGYQVDPENKKGAGRGMTIKLCPGDKGYIQANKKSPITESEKQGGRSLFAFIQITKMGKCK